MDREIMGIALCFGMATVILGVALVNAFRRRRPFSQIVSILLAGICFSSFFLFLPCYWQLSEGELPYRVGKSVTYTLYYGLKAITGGQQLGEMEKAIFGSSFSAAFRWLYITLNYIYFVAAPLLTSTLILSLIGDLWDQFRCRFLCPGNYHVFSELNANALQLAEKLSEKNAKEMLVFCGTKDADKDLVSRARTLGAALLYAPCETARLRTRGKKVQFSLISASEDENLRCAEALIGKYRDISDGTMVINAFVESGTGIQVVESLDKGNIGVRFVDGTALLCSNLLLEHPLNVLPEGCRAISVAIIGCDKTGMRMLKTAAWCGQVDGLHLKIRVYDKNAAYQEQRLRAECPELMDHCDISFLTVDAKTAELEKKIMDTQEGSPDATCIVMAMGEDELNIAVAERLFRLFRHHNGYVWTPKILARIRNSTKSGVYRGTENPYLHKRNIHLFGCLEDVFSESTLFHSYLENLSFAVELCYNEQLPEDPSVMTVEQLRSFFASEELRKIRSKYMQSEYSRRSSMAAALHIPVKLRSCGILSGDELVPTEETVRKFREALEDDPELLERLARNEHQRWNQFMRSEGYVQASLEDLKQFNAVLEGKDNKDDLSKRHLCLLDWAQLQEANDKYLELNPPKKKDFKKTDRNLIKRIPDILLLAKRMEEVEPEDVI